MTGKIFINYRRGDDPGNTGRLFDRLQDEFEPEQLFLDVDNIAPGLDFVGVLNERVGECDILLAVIGRQWLNAANAAGDRRLDDPDDFVRIEIESALAQGKRVVPVLVGEAQMPRPEDLPESLQPIARRNAVRLTHERFRADTQGLVKALQQALAEMEESRLARAKAEAARQTEERRRAAEAEAARLAQEAERKRQEDERARERAMAELRRSQEAEAARLAEEKARAAAEEARAAEERRRLEAEARRRADEEKAFASAKHTNSVIAFDAFFAAFPDGHLAGAATELRAALAAREDAYRSATASGDAAVLKSFIATYGKGVDVNEVRARLRRLEPKPVSGYPGKKAIWPAAIAAGLLIVAAVVFLTRTTSAPPPAQPVVASQPQPASPGQADAVGPRMETPDAGPAPIAPARPAGPPPDQLAWDLVKDSKDAAQFRRFIDQFPDSPYRAEAERQTAALALAAAQPQAAVAPQPDPHELARALQFELKRVGCFAGKVSGEFDDPTRNAWHQFIKLTALTMPDAATLDAITAVRAVNKRVCPLVCGSGQHAEGDLCVANAPPPSRPETPPKQRGGGGGEATVDMRSQPIGTVVQGGVTTCGPNGCQHVPKNCHVVKMGRGAPGWKGMGGKIVCP
jgi:hypothetical protein